MGTTPLTVYANVVNVKITGNELIFEFGAQFPATASAPTGKPVEFVPEVRIVLGKVALKAFADILQKASVQLEGAASTTQQQSDPSDTQSASKQ